MLKNFGSLAQTSSGNSILLGMSLVSPSLDNRKKNLAATVILTSLIDAFSILVIYLLMNFSASGENIYLRQGMELPKAFSAVTLEQSIVVQYHEGEFYINEDKTNNLVAALVQERKKLYKRAADKKNMALSLIVQSDRRVPYKYISQIIQAGAHVGFEEVKFAVLKP